MQKVANIPKDKLLYDSQSGLLILHPPKTGGTSIRHALICEGRARHTNYYNHSRLSEILWTGETLCSVRHPVDRWISGYNHVLNHLNKTRNRAFEIVRDMGIDAYSDLLFDCGVPDWCPRLVPHLQAQLTPQVEFGNEHTLWFKLEDGLVWRFLNLPESRKKVRQYDYTVSTHTRLRIHNRFYQDFLHLEYD